MDKESGDNVINIDEKRPLSKETVKLKQFGDDITYVINKYMKMDDITARDIILILADRVGTMIGLMTKKEKLYHMVCKVTKESGEIK